MAHEVIHIFGGVRFRNYDFGENTSAAGWDIFSWIPMIISGCQQILFIL